MAESARTVLLEWPPAEVLRIADEIAYRNACVRAEMDAVRGDAR
jgi:hypothetical protein